MTRRTTPLPPGWAAIRKRILERDGHRCTIIRSDDTRCPLEATDVDHIGGTNDHSDANLRSLCSWHHDKRTMAQASAAKVRRTTKFPSEKHPGLL